MSEGKTRSKWLRVLSYILKVYAALCAVLLSVVLALMLWAYLTPTVPTEVHRKAKEPDAKVWSLPPVDLSYEVPRVSASAEGLSRSSPEPDRLPEKGFPQPDSAAKRGQPVGSETNRTSSAAGPGG